MKKIPKYYLCIFLSFLISFSYFGYAETNLVKKERKIRYAVQKIAKKRNIPSLEIAVSTADRDFHFNYHHPDLFEQEIYGIGSTTKLLSAVLVMHYFEQEKIDINENVVKYIDKSDIGHIIGIDNVTVLQLLRHESGISDYANNPVWSKRIAENKAPISFDEKIKLVEAKLTSPGKFSYSNTNYLLLEKIIESVTNLNYQEAFNRYYKSLGMEIALESSTNKLQAFFASTDKNSSDVSLLQEHYGFDGGVYTTSHDLLNFFSALFISKSILSQETVSFMQNWAPMSPREIPIGSGKVTAYGAGIMNLLYKSNSYIGHMGGTLKYQSFAFFNPRDETIIIAMTNSSGRHYSNVFFQELIPAILDEM